MTEPEVEPTPWRTEQCERCGCDCYYCQRAHGAGESTCVNGHASYCQTRLKGSERAERVNQRRALVRAALAEQVASDPAARLTACIVSYTNSDDGIWVDCRLCEWRDGLGWEVTVQDIAEACERHVQAEHLEPELPTYTDPDGNTWRRESKGSPHLLVMGSDGQWVEVTPGTSPRLIARAALHLGLVSREDLGL